MPSFSKLTGDEPKYTPVEEAPLMEESIGSETDLPTIRKRRGIAKLRAQAPWILSAVLLILLGVSWTFQWSSKCGEGSFEHGFNTELSERTIS